MLILENLNAADLYKIMLTNKTFYILANNEDLWGKICKNVELYHENQHKSYKNYYR